MSSAPVRGIVPHRQRRHHHHHHHHHQHDKCRKRNGSFETKFRENGVDSHAAAQLPERNNTNNNVDVNKIETVESRPKVNPIFLWAAQREQRIVEVRCEDYDKRNRIKLTKTAQGWRSIPRTALTTYSAESIAEEQHNGDTTSSTASQNEEKENSSTKLATIKLANKGEFDSTETSNHSQTSEMEDSEERVKRKRKKHGSCSKNKKRKDNLEREDDDGEILVTSSWKMKKRKKNDKSKKRKKMRLEQEVIHEDSTIDIDEVIVKEESDNQVTSKVHTIFDTTDSEDSATAANKDFKNCVDSRHFQPRVVLEQLHFPLLSTKTMPRVVKNKVPEVITAEKKNIDKVMCNGVTRINKRVESVPLVVEETIINNEDLQEILNKLDANHIPIDTNKTKLYLNDSKELPRNCTKIGAAILDAAEEKEDVDKPFKPCDTQNLMSVKGAEKQNKFSSKDKNKCRSGSRSLDETIERLEKSIISQKKLNTLPVDSTALAAELKPDGDQKNFEQDTNENSKSLDFLKNKPDITISLVNRKKDELLENGASSMSALPDSQTEMVDNKESHSGPFDCNPLQVASSDLKSRVDSPESTVHLSKHEDLCDTHTNGETEFECVKVRLEIDEKCQSDNENFNNNNIDYKKNFGEKGRKTCENEAVKDNEVDSPKTAIRSPLLNQNKCSEAQAKLLVQSKCKDDNNLVKQVDNEFCCQVSPQPSSLSSSMSPLRRSSSVYLERLLPSPPCSVSCSDDAKNDLTLASILSTSNEDLKDAVAQETGGEFNVTNDLELNSAYVVPAVKNEKGTTGQDEKPFLQEQMSKLKMNKQENPMICEELEEFASATSGYPYLKRSQSTEENGDQKRFRNNNNTFSIKSYHEDDTEYIEKSKIKELQINPVIFLDPANQLRELLRTSGHLIPDPLLVPRDYLPLIASAPLTEIPNLLATRPELRLPEALTRPELLTDPDLLVISLAHLQHVLDHGDASVSKPYQAYQPILISKDDSKDDIVKKQNIDEKHRPKLSCKPIGKLMPVPIDLSNNQKSNTKPPLLRVRSGLFKQESEVSSTANSPDDLQLWHPLFGSQKQRQQQQQSAQEQKPHQASWHRTTLTS